MYSSKDSSIQKYKLQIHFLFNSNALLNVLVNSQSIVDRLFYIFELGLYFYIECPDPLFLLYNMSV